MVDRRRATYLNKLFAFLARNTEDITATYPIPADQVMTVGLQVGI